MIGLEDRTPSSCLICGDLLGDEWYTRGFVSPEGADEVYICSDACAINAATHDVCLYLSERSGKSVKKVRAKLRKFVRKILD